MKSAKKSGKVNRAWLHEHVGDAYVRQAQKDGYRSRAAYKLKEIDEALRLVKPDACVVDLGSAPGAWSQYLQRKLMAKEAGRADPRGKIVALDLLPMAPIDGVVFLQGDFRERQVLADLIDALDGRRPDVVVSDMAPNLTGIAASDAVRISHLVELAVAFAGDHLTPEGALVVKAFHGSGYSQLVRLFKDCFASVKPIKPDASRSRSAETYLVGRGLKTSRSR